MPNQKLQREFTLVEEAMGNPSGWIVYWGITVLFIFLIVCLGISAVVSYPDTLKAKGIIYTNRPPVDVFTTKKGVLVKVWVKDKQRIIINEPLVVLETGGSWKDILSLDTALQNGTITKLDNNFRLGRLNSAYQAILLAQKQLNQLQENDITFQKIETLEEEVIQIKKLTVSLERQSELFEEELVNIQKDFERSKSLFETKTISEQEVEKTENRYLQSKRELESMQAAVILNTIRIQQIQVQVLDLKKEKRDVFFSQKNQLKEHIENLRTGVETWKENNLILASISGVISMPLDLEDGVSVEMTTPLMTILPSNKQKVISVAKVSLGSQGIGKLKKGQMAKVYLDNYPSGEYGTIKAEVTDIALVPQEKRYIATLNLPDTLLTSYGIIIPRQENMTASVSIYTQNYTVLERIFSGLIDAFNN
jgi:multidrug resistance efflux pump